VETSSSGRRNNRDEYGPLPPGSCQATTGEREFPFFDSPEGAHDPLEVVRHLPEVVRLPLEVVRLLLEVASVLLEVA
jgi:hypothetical protein